ncbi:MAG: SRPBCC family protein [Tepidisphaeraceae bacterium]
MRIPLRISSFSFLFVVFGTLYVICDSLESNPTQGSSQMKNTLSLSAPTDREIVLIRGFDAPRALVYDAITKPQLVQRWLLGPPGWSMPVCEIDLRVGGRFRYLWRNTDGREMGMSGVYRELAPPDRIIHTELFDEDWTGGETVVTQVLSEQQSKTTLTVTIRYASEEIRDAVLKSPMETGVAASYDRLEELVTASARK